MQVAATSPLRACALAAAAAGVWLALSPNSPDLAAQVYRAGLFGREGFAVWDGNWYAGHHLPGYSLLFPPLGSLLGARTVGVVAAIASAFLFERLARRRWGDAATLGIAWFAVATSADLLIGRVTYSLGVAIGLGAMLAHVAGRPRLAVALAAATSAGSPVAGLFVALAGGTLLICDRDRRGAWLAAGALAPIVALAVLFPEGGRQPFSVPAVLAVLGAAVVLHRLLPERERALRTGAALYGVAALTCFALSTPIGSNVTRLGATFAGPVLVCAAATRERRVALLLASAPLLAWQWYAPVRESVKGFDPSTEAAYYAPLIGWLGRHSEGPQRIEVPFSQTHWEAVHLARHVPLARGWETQLDTKHNALFFERTVGVNAYRRWLRVNAVRYVAVPDAPLDRSGVAEAQLIDLGVPYLRLVQTLAHWRVYEVTRPLALVQGAATLTRLEPTGFTLRWRRPGRALVRVRWTPYWDLTLGRGCVSRAPGGWTYVQSAHRQTVRVEARFRPGRVLRSGASCRLKFG